jgi:hypothetical protein
MGLIVLTGGAAGLYALPLAFIGAAGFAIAAELASMQSTARSRPDAELIEALKRVLAGAEQIAARFGIDAKAEAAANPGSPMARAYAALDRPQAGGRA